MGVVIRAGMTSGLAALVGTGLALAAPACSSSSNGEGAPDAHADSAGFEASFPEGGGHDGGTPSEGGGDGGSSPDAGGDGGGDAGNGCPPGGGDGGPGSFTCAGMLGKARIAPAAGALPGGKVLVAGGWKSGNGTLKTAEVFDPVAGTSTATASMNSDHLWGGWGGAMPVLAGGKLLAAGGLDSTGALVGAAELYDPVNGTFTATGSMPTPVISMFPVVLGDGSVLYIGGWNSTTGAPPTPAWQYTGSGTSAVQRYSPSTGQFTTTGPLAENRLNGCDVVLASGKVLAIGGSTGPTSTEASIEQYDPSGGTWTTVGTLTSPATCNQAFLLPGGKILMTGTGSTPDAQLLDPGTYTATATTGTSAGATGMYTQLSSGDVLGVTVPGTSSTTQSAYVFHASTGAWTQVDDLPAAHGSSFVFVPLSTGDVAIVGGNDLTGAATARVDVFHP